ncbi:MAG: leucine-rich repeat protein [Clostridia bacterium]|nr:leucine-rich repeat protein [Clostridia bacterium]
MKRTANRILSVVIAAVMILSIAPFGVFAAGGLPSLFVVAHGEGETEGTCGTDLTWTLDGEGTLTIAGAGDMTNFKTTGSPFYGRTDIVSVVIEDGVTSLGNYAFSRCTSVENVSIPGSVTKMGYNVFYNCSSLGSVTIPGSVAKIGSSAFNLCGSLSEVTIEYGVGAIDSYAFSNCGSLTSVSIPDSVTAIGNGAFKGCGALAELSLGSGVKTIGESAFEDCVSLVGAAIPAGATGIGAMAFFNCTNLSELSLPDSVTSIGTSAFDNTAYFNNPANWTDGVLYLGAHLLEVDSAALPSIYVIKDETRTITEYAFSDCTLLESVTIPGELSVVNTCAFYGCSSLKYVCIYPGVAQIERNAFYNCTGLTDVYYFGSEEQWNAITIAAGNGALGSAEKHFNADPDEHAWNSGIVIQDPTCTEDGVRQLTCVICGATMTEPVPATGHTWGAWKKYSNTYHQRICETDPSHVQQAKHKWNSGVITKAPTCTATGVKTYTCSVCGGKKTATVAATDHSWGAWTNYDAAQHSRVCANDASHIEYEDHAWNSGVITKSPTCTAKGVRTYTCTVCGAKKTASVKAKGHKYGDWTKLDDTLHQKVCANDASHVITEEHTWDEGVVTRKPTTTVVGIKTFTCAVCGGTRTETIPKALAKIAAKAENTSTGIKLTWTQDPNATGYYVIRKTGSSSYSTLKKITSKTTVSYEDTTAENGTVYTYAVRSYRGTEKAAYTAKTITRLAPITPKLANVVGGVKVTWTKVAGATGYYVFRKSGSGSYETLEKIESAATLSYTDNTAESGVTYTYGVRAYKSTTKGAFTAKSILCLSSVAPTMTNTASGAVIKWTQVPGATGYEVYRKPESGSAVKITTITDAATLTYTDKAIKDDNGSFYTYFIKAFNKDTFSGYIEKPFVRLIGNSISSLTNSTAGSLNVKWTKNESASGYQIQYATNSSFTGAKTVTVKYAVSLSKTISDLTKGSTYYVRVRVYATREEVNFYSAWSAVKSLKLTK